MLNRQYKFCNNNFSLIASTLTRHGLPHYVVVRLVGHEATVVRSAMSEGGILLLLGDELRKAEGQQAAWMRQRTVSVDGLEVGVI